MATSTLFDYLDALKTTLEADGDLAGVSVLTATHGTETPREAIVFHSVEATQDELTMGRREETYEVLGLIWIVKPGQGESIVKDARDRVEALLAQVEQNVRSTPAMGVTGVLHAEIGRVDLEQGMNTDGRWCQCNFRIAVMAELT